jgi:hypothetical protein
MINWGTTRTCVTKRLGLPTLRPARSITRSSVTVPPAPLTLLAYGQCELGLQGFPRYGRQSLSARRTYPFRYDLRRMQGIGSGLLNPQDAAVLALLQTHLAFADAAFRSRTTDVQSLSGSLRCFRGMLTIRRDSVASALRVTRTMSATSNASTGETARHPRPKEPAATFTSGRTPLPYATAVRGGTPFRSAQWCGITAGTGQAYIILQYALVAGLRGMPTNGGAASHAVVPGHRFRGRLTSYGAHAMPRRPASAFDGRSPSPMGA